MNPGNTGIAELKERVALLDLLAADGLLVRRAGTNHVCRCPFHDERSASFTVFPDGGFKCFGCGAAGDVLDYVMLRDGCDFATARAKLEALAGLSPRPHVRAASGGLTPREQAGVETLYRLSDAELRQAVNAAEALLRDERLMGRIAAARGWRPETIRGLALDPSLGWMEGKLAFLYDTGLKLRWRTTHGERRFAFACGKAESLWRASFVRAGTRTIYVTEGESDAISLVDAGVEGDGLETIVVALPGASIIRAEWAPLFTGREAILCFDADEAGERAAKKLAALIAPYTAKVSKLNWRHKEAARAHP
jgi:DNA primase